MKLAATECNLSGRDDDGCAYIWFADRSQSPIQYFTMSRELDNLSSLIYLERDDQKWGTYGSLKKIVLRTGSLEIEVEENTAAELNSDCKIEVTFNPSLFSSVELESCLIAIVGSDNPTVHWK